LPIEVLSMHPTQSNSIPQFLIVSTILSNPPTFYSVVGLATGYGMDDRGVVVRVPVGSRIFSTSYREALGPTQPPIQWVPGVKRQGREADHSPPASAEVKKMWIYISTPPYPFMA
jgi:hypothetical protein